MVSNNHIITELICNNRLYARVINYYQDFEGKSKFFSAKDDVIQLAVHRPEKGQIFTPHYHLTNCRNTTKTQEVLVVLSGKMTVQFHDELGDFLGDYNLIGGQAIVLLDGAHGFKVQSENCRFLEVKNGPYLGAELDRKQIG